MQNIVILRNKKRYFPKSLLYFFAFIFLWPFFIVACSNTYRGDIIDCVHDIQIRDENKSVPKNEQGEDGVTYIANTFLLFRITFKGLTTNNKTIYYTGDCATFSENEYVNFEYEGKLNRSSYLVSFEKEGF